MNVLTNQEIKKSISTKYFIITCIIGIVITLLGGINRISCYIIYDDLIQSYDGILTKNPNLASDTLFNYWIGGEFSSVFYSLFFTLIPLIATFPYGWSFFIERKNGYIKNIVTRTTKNKYFLAKYFAVFISGGLSVLIPLIINFALVACFVPAYTPDVYYDIYYGVGFIQAFSKLFYTFPLIYIFIYMVLNFIFGGLISSMSLAITFFVRNRVAVVLTPFFLLLGLNYINMFSPKYELSPMNFLHCARVVNISNGWIILAEALILFLITFGITMWKGNSDDVY